MTDPNHGACESSTRTSIPVTVFTLLIERPQTRDALVLFSNLGDVSLTWNLSFDALSSSWTISPSNYGHLDPSDGFMQVRLFLNSTFLQARAAPYTTRFMPNASSPTPTPSPEASSVALVVHTIVLATPIAARSNVTVRSSGVSASSMIEFDVTPIDGTGQIILDAAAVAYTANLLVNTTGGRGGWYAV